ncbi:MAG TPA: protein kinase, partial [Euzebya sp.]|nr:protein kinase [Euzebya sp.]
MRVIADRYELHESLGHGGMARVYVAIDRILDRRVAMKLLRDDVGRDDVLRERFLREARLAGGLTHRNIVRVFDAGVDAETPWIAMELVEGPSLREAMSSQGHYDAAEAVDLISQVLEALGAAHAAGVVHRDIKPANILIAADGPKLSDFGIAKSLAGGADLTQTNQFMGTPKYTAPEVAMGHPATPQADVYSAAVVLWEMLAGEPPYEHDNPLTLAMMHRTDPLPSLSAARPDLAVTLVAAVEAGLAKEPPDRPVDAKAFAAVLDAGLRGDVGAAAAMTATAVLPRVPVPPAPRVPPPREPTMAMPAPVAVARPGRGPSQGHARGPGRGSAPGPAARRAVPPPRRGRGGAGVAVVVVVLLLLAAFAYSRTDSSPADPEPTATQTPAPTPSATPTSSAPAEPAPPAPPPPPATEPTPLQTTTAPETTPSETTPPAVPSAGDPAATPTQPTPSPRPTEDAIVPAIT